jgi:2,3-bisphosphoglycerate-independent phosphoglycerate mutase
MNSPEKPKFVCLVVLDGWGLAAPGPGNAISLANTVNMNRFMSSYPHTQLVASGESVGLPQGEAGNTETGHLNLGAGRIVYQDLARINLAIADGSFFSNQNLIEAIAHAKKFNSALHLMGLIGSGGVHSNLEHLYAILQLCKRLQFGNVFLHLFTDGRDSPPTSSKIYIKNIRDIIARDGIGQIATIMGRYWAMDRDFRWDRTAKAYTALTKGQAQFVATPEEAIDKSYALGKTDEFIEPSIILNADKAPTAIIKDNDSIIFFNFRVDRPRQLTSAFVFKDFHPENISWGFDPFLSKYTKSHLTHVAPVKDGFIRGEPLKNLFFVMMTEYAKPLVQAGAHAAFPPEVVKMPLGRVVSENDLKQLRMCESEKERFVTFYFNGMQEQAFFGEERLIVPSPKVTTYDLKPEMSAREITDQLLLKLRASLDYSFILVNFANPDMVGHTGNIGAATRAIEVVDECIGKIANFILAYEGSMIITADHGNAEEMINPRTGEIDTEHNGNPVPFLVISREYLGRSQILPEGILADVAPTVLSLLGLAVPSTMSGRNLLESFIY